MFHGACAQLKLGNGGGGLRSVANHASAGFIASSAATAIVLVPFDMIFFKIMAKSTNLKSSASFIEVSKNVYLGRSGVYGALGVRSILAAWLLGNPHKSTSGLLPRSSLAFGRWR